MIPTNIYLANNLEDHTEKIKEMYNTLSSSVNGTATSFDPVLTGSTTAGTPTYTTQEGWYYIQGIIVDYWFNVVWSAWATGAGDIQLGLPYTVYNTVTNLWVGECSVTGLTLADPSDTFVHPIGKVSTKFCRFVSGHHNAASGIVQINTAGGVNTTGGIRGHLRYIVKSEG